MGRGVGKIWGVNGKRLSVRVQSSLADLVKNNKRIRVNVLNVLNVLGVFHVFHAFSMMPAHVSSGNLLEGH